MAVFQNLTPAQRQFPKIVRVAAYKRMPETCNHVSGILDEAASEILVRTGMDEAELDMIMRSCFARIRDEVTQEFRTEQMNLINRMYEELGEEYEL